MWQPANPLISIRAVRRPDQPLLTEESAALLDELLLVYEQLTIQGDDSDEFRQRIATAHRRIGDIRQRLGQRDQARSAYIRAIGMYRDVDPQLLREPEGRGQSGSRTPPATSSPS